MPPPSVHDLRALLAQRFPAPPRSAAGVLPTGVASWDALLEGGLPLGALTEWVAQAPSSGSQTALRTLLLTCRDAQQRVAWIDPQQTLDTEELTADEQSHLLWLRGGELSSAFAAADLLLHDGNLPLVVLDLREAPVPALRTWPATGWYRLQRAAETSGVALLCCTPCPLVPSAAVRLAFTQPALTPDDRLTPWSALPDRLPLRQVRGRSTALHAAFG